MIRADNLAARLANILSTRGRTADFLVDCRVVDDGDGLSPRLAFWDEVKLGLTPTQPEVDAASQQPPVLTQDQLEAICQAWLNGVGNPAIDPRKVFKAKLISDLAFRLGVAPGALTGPQLLAERNRIAAIYKAL